MSFLTRVTCNAFSPTLHSPLQRWVDWHCARNYSRVRGSLTVMARFALFGPPLPSHLFFAASVGRELLRRGHTVIQIGLRDAQTAIEQQGVPYAPIGERD